MKAVLPDTSASPLIIWYLGYDGLSTLFPCWYRAKGNKRMKYPANRKKLINAGSIDSVKIFIKPPLKDASTSAAIIMRIAADVLGI